MTDLQHRLGPADAARFEAPPPNWAAEGQPAYTPITVQPPAPRKPWWKRGPSAAERKLTADTEVIRGASFPRSLHVVVANPKSSMKTPTVRLLADAIGVARGGDVIAWDGSEDAGTLDARSVGRQSRGQSDVIGYSDQFATRASIGNAVAVQPSNAHVMGAGGQRHLVHADVLTIMALCDPHYGLQLIDTGANALHSQTFITELAKADAVVVPTTRFADSVNRAAELLYLLSTEHPALLRRTLVVVSDYGDQVSTEDALATVQRAAGPHITVEHIPFDTHISEGGALRYDRLAPVSQRAWTNAAARLIELTKGI